MGLRAKSLAPGEHVVLSVRTHWKALVGPVFLLLFVMALAGFGGAVLPAGRHRHDGELAIVAVAALLVLRLTVWPFLQWFHETFTITDRRLAHRAGVVRRTGRDLPLSRIADVSYDRSLWDRLCRCGTLIVQTAGETGDIVFDDIPHVDEFETALTELCYGPQRFDRDDPTERDRAEAAAVAGRRDAGRGRGRRHRAAAEAVSEPTPEQPARERPEYGRAGLAGRRDRRDLRRARATQDAAPGADRLPTAGGAGRPSGSPGQPGQPGQPAQTGRGPIGSTAAWDDGDDGDEDEVDDDATAVVGDGGPGRVGGDWSGVDSRNTQRR